jgi:hypothetical protein
MTRITKTTILILAVSTALAAEPLFAQTTVRAVPATSAASAPAPPAAKPFKKEEVEQLVAPFALYPDSLLSQILMASTYPLEVVQADRFVKTNADLKGDALTAALEKEDWDASVKSLVNFPTVLSMMSEKLDSTIRLGDAMLENEKMVMDAVQSLRGKAKSQGNLETTPQQTVIVEQAPADTGNVQVIRIEPANPQVVYVPTYNPTVVYGAWPYPAYPPTPWYPPGYVASGVIGFGVGFACGAAWGYAWGHCNWGGGDIDVDVNRNANFNQNIDRSKYQNQINNLKANNTNIGSGNRGQNSWQHNPADRKGVAYRDQSTAQRFGGASSNQAIQARDQFRGRTDAGRNEIAQGGASQFRGANAPRPSNPTAGGNIGSGARPSNPTAGGGLGSGARPSAQPANANRSASGLNSGGGARATQNASQRGAVSRSSAPSAAPRSSGGGLGAGGGGARTGGGGGGGRTGGGGGRR